MTADHAHVHSDTVPVLAIHRWTRFVVLGLVALSGFAALLGVLHWWPDTQRLDDVQGVIPRVAKGAQIVPAQLVTVKPACTTVETPSCGDSEARVLDGSDAGKTYSITLAQDVIGTGLRPGDRVLLLDTSGIAQGPSAASFYRADRSTPMLLLLVLFVAAVLIVATRRGLMALVSLGFAGVVVIGFLIPALLSGMPPVPVTISSAVLILIVMLYLTHGFSMRTSVALLGALIGIGLAAAFASAGIVGARLGGLSEPSSNTLTYDVPWIDVQQLIVASVLLASIGTLNDVTVTQVSALWELRAASPSMTRWQLFRSAMRIGRDHVASTVYTLVFAYLGTALVLLVAVQVYAGSGSDFLTSDEVAEEIVRTLVGGLSLALAMPVTTAIGALVVSGAARRS